MSLRLLVPVATYPDATPSESLKKIVHLASMLGASATAVVHHVLIPNLANPATDFVFRIEAMAKEAEAQSRGRGAALREELEGLCRDSDVPLWVETLASERPIGERLAAKARSYDICAFAVLPDSPDHAMTVEDVLFGSGAPILVVGGDDAPCHLHAVSVAWDGGRAASRALRDALPVLKRAEQVRLLTCSQDKAIDPESIDGALAYLQSHDVAAEHVSFELGEGPLGEALQRTAVELGSGLLVMGGYGHSRVREFILGGATSVALRRPRLAVLMSH